MKKKLFMTFEIPVKMKEQIRWIAFKKKVSLSEAARGLIERGLKNVDRKN